MNESLTQLSMCLSLKQNECVYLITVILPRQSGYLVKSSSVRSQPLDAGTVSLTEEKLDADDNDDDDDFFSLAMLLTMRNMEKAKQMPNITYVLYD